MNEENTTMVAYFILKGITDDPELQTPIFLLVLLIYLITLGANTIILLLVGSDSQLHTPMYFFLCNLSILDVSSTTVTLHKILIVFVTRDNVISVINCRMQLFIFSWLSGTELILLTAMSYDRYVAICNPLRYLAVMNGAVCAGLATSCWLIGLLQILPEMIMLLRFSCYFSNIINHFFCDFMPLMNLSCNDTSVLQLMIFIQGSLFAVFIPFLLTFISYVFIISTIMRIRSSTGRSKAFYTCSSHLTVVSLHYTAIICQYLTPSGTFKSSKLLSLLNTAVVPMLNPLIYSLKNKDVKSALQRKLKHCKNISVREEKNLTLQKLVT
ncbi:olfactory receptor 6C3-like [Hyperolius riggenbachi]|uniref:olfactory receptor 6C3-like n=1 Tax=Hyperolius riggenbachi TaxID=752182 RepID=UPI0035A35EF4